MLSPLLSVVIPHKNRLAQLRTSLSYWRRQRGIAESDVQLIVVDDGCSPACAAMVESYGVLYLSNPAPDYRASPISAWNKGLRAASGQVLACTHPEIAPGLDAARFLAGVCLGDSTLLRGIPVWVPDAEGRERVLSEKDVRRLSRHCVRANVQVFRLSPEHIGPLSLGDFDPDEMIGWPGFLDKTTEFGGHTNREIRDRFRGFFWNNCFAMRSDLWRWVNYHRPSEQWGVDDTDFQERNQLLKITYVFGDKGPFGYHQPHGGEMRAGFTDVGAFKTLDDARLLNLYPTTAGDPCPLERGDFWAEVPA